MSLWWILITVTPLLFTAWPPQRALAPRSDQGGKMTPSEIVERVKRKDRDVMAQPGSIGADAGPALLPLLDNPDPQVRVLTVECLNVAGGAAARHGLLKALHDPIETVRGAAARYLSAHYDKQDLPVIQRELGRSPDEFVREQLALLLGMSGDAANIPVLLGRARAEKDENARHAASLALARLGESEHRTLLIDRLKRDDPEERTRALRDLPYVNDRSLLKHVVPLLDDTRPGLNVGPSHGPYFIRVCDVAVNVANDMLGKPFPWVEPVKRYSAPELSEAKRVISAIG
jgi:hypothetical protein